jgi:NTE family protein
MSAKKIGLVLSGGGARGAYQVGVLHGLCQMIKEHELKNPLIIFGSSAGAISGAHMAANAHKSDFNINRLVQVWANLHSSQVFKTTTSSLLWKGFKICNNPFCWEAQ